LAEVRGAGEVFVWAFGKRCPSSFGRRKGSVNGTAGRMCQNPDGCPRATGPLSHENRLGPTNASHGSDDSIWYSRQRETTPFRSCTMTSPWYRRLPR